MFKVMDAEKIGEEESRTLLRESEEQFGLFEIELE